MIDLFFIFDAEFLELKNIFLSSLDPIKNELQINGYKIPITNNTSGFRSEKWYNAIKYKLSFIYEKYFSLQKNQICIFSDVDVLILEPEKVLQDIKILTETNEAIFLSENYHNDYCKEVNTGFFIVKRTKNNDTWIQNIQNYDCKRRYLGDQNIINMCLNKHKVNYKRFNTEEYVNLHYINDIKNQQQIKLIHATGTLTTKHKSDSLKLLLENKTQNKIYSFRRPGEDILLVICRYNEDISWLREINIPYVVYDKSEVIYDWFNTKKIPNIGYEEFAYLNFIVDNYNDLPNRTIFCQANSIEHNPKFLELISKSYLMKHADTQPLSSYWKPEVPGNILTSITEDILSINEAKIHVDFFDGNNARYNIVNNKFELHPQKQQKDLHGLLSDFLKNKDIRKGMANFIELPLRTFSKLEMTPMCYAALFSVTKEKILKHPKKYYKKLLDMDVALSKKQSFPKNKIFGWIMEYLWLELFEYEPPIELYDTFSYKNMYKIEKKTNINNTRCSFVYKNTIKQKDGKRIKYYECNYCNKIISELEYHEILDSFICVKKLIHV